MGTISYYMFKGAVINYWGGGGGPVNFGGGLWFFGRPFGVGHNFMGPRFIGEGYNFWAPFIKTLGHVHKWVLCH